METYLLYWSAPFNLLSSASRSQPVTYYKIDGHTEAINHISAVHLGVLQWRGKHFRVALSVFLSVCLSICAKQNHDTYVNCPWNAWPSPSLIIYRESGMSQAKIAAGSCLYSHHGCIPNLLGLSFGPPPGDFCLSVSEAWSLYASLRLSTTSCLLWYPVCLFSFFFSSLSLSLLSFSPSLFLFTQLPHPSSLFLAPTDSNKLPTPTPTILTPYLSVCPNILYKDRLMDQS